MSGKTACRSGRIGGKAQNPETAAGFGTGKRGCSAVAVRLPLE
ncbi:hypothetical protein [Treponema endosymbiont of Eucomonympha sp.]|nr:hypothetical protein [Treponema endosymbiont of Eucomonympha sp.]